MEAWAARPAPCDPRVGADQRPGTISACCPAASAGLPVVTSFPCGGGPGCPHDQAPATSSPKATSASRSLAAPVNGRAPEPATDGRSRAKPVAEPSAPPDPGVSPRVPGIPEVPVDEPGASPPVPSGEVVPGGGAMIPPVLVSVPVLTPTSTPIPVSIPVFGLVPVPASMPEAPMLRSMSMVLSVAPESLSLEVPQSDEASPSTPTLLQETVTGTVADTSSTLTAAWLPARVPLVWVKSEVPADDPPSEEAGWPVPQLAETSPRAPTLLPQTVTGTDGETSPTFTPAWLPEAIGPVSRTPIPAGVSPVRSSRVSSPVGRRLSVAGSPTRVKGLETSSPTP